MNLAYLLESSAREYPSHVALKVGGRAIEYAALNAMASKMAHGLGKIGIGRGDRVAISCPSIPAFPVIYYAVMKIGAVAVPLNLLLKPDEIAEQLELAGVKAYFCFEGTDQFPLGQMGLQAFGRVSCCKSFLAIGASPEGLTRLAEQTDWTSLMAEQSAEFASVDLPGDTTASISFTSGTTGTPKGAEHSHMNEYLATVLVRDELGIRHDDVALSALPLFSLWRCAILHATFLTGSTAVLLPRFDPVAVWETILAEKVTYFYGVPAMFAAMEKVILGINLDTNAVARTWRGCAFGGAPFPRPLRRFYQETFELDIRQGYGLTEVIFAVLDKSGDEESTEFIGRPIPGVQLRIVDEAMNDVPHGTSGEIVVRSPTVMKAYHKQPEWTSEAFAGGWFHTGDVGQRDEAGNLYLVDRIKDMINRSSFKVYPAQVESVLATHPAIAQVAVMGIPSEEVGEEVCAWVVLEPGAELDAADLVTWSRERVAAHAYPREVRFVERLPTTPTGKVLKRLLRESPHARES